MGQKVTKTNDAVVYELVFDHSDLIDKMNSLDVHFLDGLVPSDQQLEVIVQHPVGDSGKSLEVMNMRVLKEGDKLVLRFRVGDNSDTSGEWIP